MKIHSVNFRGLEVEIFNPCKLLCFSALSHYQPENIEIPEEFIKLQLSRGEGSPHSNWTTSDLRELTEIPTWPNKTARYQEYDEINVYLRHEVSSIRALVTWLEFPASLHKQNERNWPILKYELEVGGMESYETNLF